MPQMQPTNDSARQRELGAQTSDKQHAEREQHDGQTPYGGIACGSGESFRAVPRSDTPTTRGRGTHGSSRHRCTIARSAASAPGSTEYSSTAVSSSPCQPNGFTVCQKGENFEGGLPPGKTSSAGVKAQFPRSWCQPAPQYDCPLWILVAEREGMCNYLAE